MEHSKEPRLDLAKQVLPQGLYTALYEIFEENCAEAMLVGGTALAGYYAGHRRSDDLDIFVKDEASFQMVLNSVKALRSRGAQFTGERTTPNYYKVVAAYLEHSFTIDIVIDDNLFRVGDYQRVDAVIPVATLATLLKMKCATLVFRASEKDLYDLIWLMEAFSKLTVAEIISEGRQIDAGVNGEAIVLVLGSTEVKREACGFAEEFGRKKAVIHKEIEAFRKKLLRAVSEYLHKQPARPILAEMVEGAKVLSIKMGRKK